MATVAHPRLRLHGDQRFFLISSFVMAAFVVAGFGMQFLMGRSTFASPPLVHLHAVVFMGWVGFYVMQNILAATGSIALHRRMGWIGLGWMIVMVVLGSLTTIVMVREGRVPFFFPPAYFLVMNPLSVLTFAGLGIAAIMMRRRTDWHRRLHFCAMAFVIGPAFGRLLPLPLMIPWAGWGVFAALILFPVAGMVADRRRSGRIHPAWWYGVAVMLLSQVAMDVIAFSPVGRTLYAVTVAGSPAAATDPFAFPPPPGPPPGLN